MKNSEKKTERRDSLIKKSVILGVFAIIAGIFIVIEPAFPWNGGMEMTDSSVFLTIGRQMKEGATPYVDTFDHKGPLLYVINFLAVTINETKGIFIFEFLAIFVTLWYMYKIFRLKNDNVWFSGVMTVILFTPYIYFSEGGNLTEQYAMPFIAYSLYVFLEYFLKEKTSSLKTFLAGMSLMCVLMMRVNMAGIWLVFSVGILIKSLIKKEFSELWRYIIWFTIGMLCVVAPIFIWLLANGAFGAFVDIYIKFNLLYSVAGQVNGVIPTTLFFVGDTIILLSGCLTIFMIASKNNDKFMALTYAAAFVVCILTTCMSGRISAHYGMALVPLSVFPFAVFCRNLNQGNNSDALLAFVLIFLVSLTFTDWSSVVRQSTEALHKELKYGEMIAVVDKVCESVEKYTDVSDKISVYGNWNYIYLRCNRLPISKYSYQFPIGEIDQSIMDEYFDEIEALKPKAFVVRTVRWNEKNTESNNQRVSDFVEKYGYIEEWGEDEIGTKVYVLKGV